MHAAVISTGGVGMTTLPALQRATPAGAPGSAAAAPPAATPAATASAPPAPTANPPPLENPKEMKSNNSRGRGGGRRGGRPDGDEYLWTTQISNLTKRGLPRQALAVYHEMRARRVPASSYTLVAALQACLGAGDPALARAVHAHAAAAGLAAHPHVASAAVAVLGKLTGDGGAAAGEVLAAAAAAVEPAGATAAWNAAVWACVARGRGRDAVAAYDRMRAAGVPPDARTLAGVAKACGLAFWEAGEAEGEERWVEVLREVEREMAAMTGEKDGEHEKGLVVVGNAVVDAYGRCGRARDAKRVFEGMPVRDVVSWTAVVGAVVAAGDGEAGVRLFRRMVEAGVEPDEQALVGVLKACSTVCAGGAGRVEDRRRDWCLDQVRAVEERISNSSNSTRSNVYVGSALVDAYGKCGAAAAARRVFDAVPVLRTVAAAWNAVIAAHAEAGEFGRALAAFRDMQQQQQQGGVVPDARTLAAVLKACCGCCDQQQQGSDDGDDGMSSSSSSSSSSRPVEVVREVVREVHALAARGGVCDGDLAALVVAAYVKCGDVPAARGVWDAVPPEQRSLGAWNAMMWGYVQEAGAVGAGAAGAGSTEEQVQQQVVEAAEEALRLYDRMVVLEKVVAPDERTFVAALRACAILATQPQKPNALLLERVCGIHEHMKQAATAGRAPTTTRMYNALVQAYAKCGSLADARRAFAATPRRDAVSYTTMLWALLRRHPRSTPGASPPAASAALRLLLGPRPRLRRRDADVHMDARLLTAVAAACGAAGALSLGRRVHRTQVPPALAAQDPHLAAAVTTMYARCGALRDARAVVAGLPPGSPAARDPVPWTALISGLARHGGPGAADAAFRLFRRVPRPDGPAYLALLAACARGERLDAARAVVAAMGSVPGPRHLTCLVGLLGRAGRLGEAVDVAGGAGAAADARVWGAVLAGCRRWGDVEAARTAYARAVEAAERDEEPGEADAAHVVMGEVLAAAGLRDEAAQVWGKVAEVEVEVGGGGGAQRRRWRRAVAAGRSWWADGEGGVVGFKAAEGAAKLAGAGAAVPAARKKRRGLERPRGAGAKLKVVDVAGAGREPDDGAAGAAEGAAKVAGVQLQAIRPRKVVKKLKGSKPKVAEVAAGAVGEPPEGAAKVAGAVVVEAPPRPPRRRKPKKVDVLLGVVREPAEGAAKVAGAGVRAPRARKMKPRDEKGAPSKQASGGGPGAPPAGPGRGDSEQG